MKVFVSSLISGFGHERQACRGAITALRHEPVMAEDFGASPHSPQVSCLQGLRSADLVVLVLGQSYGQPQPGSGLSATHEEYREAKGRKPVIAFVQESMTPEPQQAAFIREVQEWENGLFRVGFRAPDDLRDELIRALHDYDLARAVGTVDPKALVQRAKELLPKDERHSSRVAAISLAVAGGPQQQILRPAEIEAPVLGEALHREALFGARIFFRNLGVETGMDGDSLVLEQQGGGRIQLEEDGAIVLRIALEEADQRRNNHISFPAVIEETVLASITAGLNYASWLLDHVDPTQRLSHIVCAVQIEASDYMAWRTQREQDASPNGGTMSIYRNEQREPVSLHKPRPALRLDRQRIAEDLLVPLRRQWKRS
ncbi:DUF4062 domain-containing protein [Nitrobacter sp.]|uniref:DUF4062 domain-containing protein n=1 Tax=Nitrobacter sp. TaxID=29420 RepID=UPI001DC43F51|nr:DUF4062 domain-containing protein [Nitrobacter sp.]MCB1392873.1 DUF4062 domain-containing protein [Nitrobacter sp.]